MVDVGAAYHDGDGVAKDDTQAVAWYRKAAEGRQCARQPTSWGSVTRTGMA